VNHPKLSRPYLGSVTNCHRTPDDRFAGNGGLSIRKISAIKRILKFQTRFNDTNPEDEWFGARIINTPGLTVANAAMQQHFSVEEVFHEKPMGYHLRKGAGKLPEGVWKNQEQRRKIIDYCPEIKIILDMKLQRERCPGDNGEGELADLPLPPDKSEEQKQKQEEEDKKQKQEEEDKKNDEAKTAADEARKDEEAKKLLEEEAKKIEEAGMAAEAKLQAEAKAKKAEEEIAADEARKKAEEEKKKMEEEKKKMEEAAKLEAGKRQ